MSNRIKKALACAGLTALVFCGAQTRAGADEQEAARKVTKKVPPVYPEVAKLARLSGTVKLIATVSPEGDVKSVRTLGGNAVFVPAAEEAVKKWKFEPAKKETGEVVAVAFGAPAQ
jgi:TonB family protein